MVIRCSSTANDGTAVYDNMNISIWANGEAQAVTSVPYNTPSGGPRMFSGGVQRIGAAVSTTPNYYVAEIVYLDGQKQNADAFGQYDSTGTFWTPKSPDVIKELTFGTNGFYFDNATNPQTDASGQGNNYTNNNSVTTTTHTPTSLSPVFNPLFRNAGTFADGNRKLTFTGGSFDNQPVTLSIPSSGKWYHEFVCTTNANNSEFGICDTDNVYLGVEGSSASTGSDCYVYEDDGNKVNAGSSVSYGNAPTYTSGDVIGIAYDADNNAIWFSKNDSWIDGNGTDSSSTVKSEIEAGTTSSSAYTSISTEPKFFVASVASTGVATTRFESDYTGGIPTGFSALNTTKIASATTRTKSNLEEYFSTTTYEGNGAGQRVGKFLPFTNTFTVANSALFNGTNNSLDRTQVAGTSAGTVWTFSAWIKKCENKNTVYVNWGTGGTQGQLGFDASGNFVIYDGSTTVGVASREFEDVSQWSHYHVAYNTGESGTDKVKLTINGVLITNWSTDNRSSANAFQNVGINGEVMRIGNNASAGSDAISLNGYMAQVVFLDGTASAASNFGQLDTSTGRWIPSDLSSFSFGSGNNTVFLDFADSDNLGDDESGQGHDFTNVNTVVQVVTHQL